MSDPAPSVGEGPTVVTIGFKFDDTLGRMIREAKEKFSERLKEYADGDLRELSVSAESLISLTEKVDTVTEMIKAADKTASKAKKTAEEARSVVVDMEGRLHAMSAAWGAAGDLGRATGAPAPPPTTEKEGDLYPVEGPSGTRWMRKGQSGFVKGPASEVSSTVIEEKETIARVEKETAKKKAAGEQLLTSRQLAIRQMLSASVSEEELRGKPGVALTEAEEFARQSAIMLKNASPDFIRAVESSLSDEEGPYSGGPLGEQRKLFEEQSKVLKSVDIMKVVGRELREGPLGGIGGPYDPSSIIPAFEESKGGVWEKAMFRGTGAISVGPDETKRYIKDRLLTGLSLTNAQLARMKSNDRRLYESARKELEEGIGIAGISGGFVALMGGANPETGAGQLGLMGRFGQADMKAFGTFTEALGTYTELTKKHGISQYTELLKDMMDAGLSRETGDEIGRDPALRISRKIHLKHNEREISNIAMEVVGYIWDEMISKDSEAVPSGNPLLSMLRIGKQSLRDPVSGPMTALQESYTKAWRSLLIASGKGELKGTAESWFAAGFDTPHKVAGLLRAQNVIFGAGGTKALEKPISHSVAGFSATLGPQLFATLDEEGEYMRTGGRLDLETLSDYRWDEAQRREGVVSDLLSADPAHLIRFLEVNPSFRRDLSGMAKTMGLTPPKKKRMPLAVLDMKTGLMVSRPEDMGAEGPGLVGARRLAEMSGMPATAEGDQILDEVMDRVGSFVTSEMNTFSTIWTNVLKRLVKLSGSFSEIDGVLKVISDEVLVDEIEEILTKVRGD